MRDASLQVGIYDRLTAYAPLVDLVGGVYDHAPQNVAFPYVVFGDTTAAAVDTDDTTGAEHTFVIHTWSRDRGKKSAKSIMQRVCDALHRAEVPTPEGRVYGCDLEFQETFLDADGLTRHGVQRFRVHMDEV